MKKRVRYIIALVVILGGFVFFNFKSGIAAPSGQIIQGRSLLITALKGDNADRDFSVGTQVMAAELVLSISATKEFNYSVELFDITGKQLVNQKVKPAAPSFTHRLSFYDYPDGIYMLKLNSDNNATRVYRIIKSYDHAAN